jgi:DNA repair exonuclease SbcCD ATPase subunit
MGPNIAQGEPRSVAGNAGQNLHDALTNLNVYALTLEAERHRMDDRLHELVEIESSVAERRALLREREEIAEELTALRRLITALQDHLRR